MNANTPDLDPAGPERISGRKRVPSAAGEQPSRPPSYRGALVIAAAATLLMVTLLVVALTAPDRGKHRLDETLPPEGDAALVGHIHGIAAAQEADGPTGSGPVLIGAHYGLFSVAPDGTVNRVGTSAADYMALTAAEPGRLLASGHPEATDTTRPVNLGLMESRNGGVTWEALSLEGGADFHALEHTPQRTWGIDSATGGLLTSTDERTWQTVHTEPLVDLAADPGEPDRVFATTGDGQLLELTAGTQSAVEADDAPRLAFIDWPTADALAGLAADGAVWRSTDGGKSWDELARVSGQPTAFSVIGDAWFAATSDGLFRGPARQGDGTDAHADADAGARRGVTQVLTFTRPTGS